MTWRQSPATFIEQLARERTGNALGWYRTAPNGCIAQAPLYLLPEIATQDRFMLPGMTLFLVSYLSHVERVGEQFVQRPTGE